MLSNAEVASSKITIGAFFKKALAIATLCFCPPERSVPLSPIGVSKPNSKSVIKSYKHAISIAVSISACVALGFPSMIFSRIVPENKKLS